MSPFQAILSCALLGGASFACDQSTQAQLLEQRAPTELAQVGDQGISQAMLDLWPEHDETRVSALVSDTLLSLEAKASEAHRATVIERAAFSRALIESLRSQTLNKKAPTQTEIDLEMRDNWLRFARPRAVRSVVIRVPVPALVRDEPYQRLADELRAASDGAHNIEGLLAQQMTVTSGLEIQRMRMPPVASDGRVVPMISQDKEVQQVDPRFAQIVSSLRSPGELSSVFATSDAYQFAFATEIIDELKADDVESRTEIAYRVAARRLKPTLSQITHTKASKVVYSTKDVTALLKLIWRE